MDKVKHKVFISYHHDNDQEFKDNLAQWGDSAQIFEDYSVHCGDIPDDMEDEAIRVKIRDEYLRESTVTILLVGTETKHRKFIDWELYSSMRDSEKNKKSGIIVVMLPSTGCHNLTAAHDNEKTKVFPQVKSWCTVDTREEYESRYPYAPDRIIDQLVNKNAKVTVCEWNDIYQKEDKLRVLLDNAFADRNACEYDLSRPMRRKNG